MNKKRSLFIASIVSLGGFLFGFDAAVISGVNNLITTEFDLSSLQLGWVGSCVTLSSAIAMLIAGPLSNRWSRKRVLILVAVLYTFSAMASAMAVSYTMLWVARFIGGFAFGAALVLVPMYIAETVPSHYRGRMVSVNQLAIVTGFSAAFFSNYFLNDLAQSASAFASYMGLDGNLWRWMLGLEIVPALLYFILLFLIPHSPRWLFSKGREQEGLDVLRNFNGDKAELIKEEIIQSLSQDKSNENSTVVGIKNLFSKNYRFVILLGVVLGVAQMATGFNAVLFYATNIFERTGIGTDAAFAQSIWIGLINVIFTLIAIFLIDRIGRRPLLLTGLFGMAFFLGLVAYGFNQATYKLSPEKISTLRGDIDRAKLSNLTDKIFDSAVEFTEAINKEFGFADGALVKGDLIQAAGDLNAILLLIGILGVVACFAFSLGPIMWVLLSEIFPNVIRAIAISFVGGINSLTSYLVVQFFPWQLETFGASMTFIIYMGFALLAFLILLKILPETKGRTLEEIEKQFVTA